MKTLLGLIAAVFVIFTQSAIAEGYPSRPITIVVPFGAGGGTDVITRILAEYMGRKLGQNVIVENVAGAGGTIGALRVARATPDGYTLLMGNLGTHVSSLVIYPNRQYDPVSDFEPIALIANLPLFVGAKKSLPVSDFRNFVAYLKEHQKTMNYGSAGIGSSGHMVCHFLSRLLGIEVQHVPFRATGQALTSLLAGDIDYVCDAAGAITEQIANGNVKGLVISATERLPALPETPTSSEQGLPTFQAVGWNMVFAPKGMPREAVTTLSEVLATTLEDPAFRKQLIDLGALVPKAKDADQASSRELVKGEIEKWVPVLISAGLKPN